MEANKNEWISAPEAGRMLQRHPQTVKAYVERGFLFGYQPYPGAHYLISLASVERMLDARRRVLAKLQHKATEGTSDSGDETKIGVASDASGESGNAVDEELHKHPAVFWQIQTLATGQSA